jgi:hypothetical protein
MNMDRNNAQEIGQAYGVALLKGKDVDMNVLTFCADSGAVISFFAALVKEVAKSGDAKVLEAIDPGINGTLAFLGCTRVCSWLEQDRSAKDAFAFFAELSQLKGWEDVAPVCVAMALKAYGDRDDCLSLVQGRMGKFPMSVSSMGWAIEKALPPKHMRRDFVRCMDNAAYLALWLWQGDKGKIKSIQDKCFAFDEMSGYNPFRVIGLKRVLKRLFGKDGLCLETLIDAEDFIEFLPVSIVERHGTVALLRQGDVFFILQRDGDRVDVLPCDDTSSDVAMVKALI